MLKSLFIAVCSLIISPYISADTTPDQPQQAKSAQATLITEVSAKGQKISAISLEYEDNLLSGDELQDLYQVEVRLDSQTQGTRQILRAYSNNKPEPSPIPNAGKYLILELNKWDKNADLYSLKTENSEPMLFRAKNEKQEITQREIVQSNRVPQFYQERLEYVIQRQGLLKLSNGKTLAPETISVTAEPQNVNNRLIDQFAANQVYLNDPKNSLHYRLYSPQQKSDLKKHPLTIFLHGSGQLGADNMAHLLSSTGAISTLKYEDGFVLAPQYASVFDPFDDIQKGQRGGVHWQTENRRTLLLAMIDKTLQENPQIDPARIYLVGLSRGAEGALYLLLDRPHFFAAALLMSGREAYSVEWIDGNATQENLAPLADTPIWFFHSKEDKVSPVAGSRINYQILHDQLKNPNVRYTEFSFNQAGDNGILNNNPHNTWDAVFNSLEVNLWLLQQKITVQIH
ncbi:Predicted peptidase [Pasteurella testudinis DSM 23072]|uniref:Predicted peptidase n=1 Tax=Pasteurella testudinis DSM 23072 TaxID=1122938 RepID=A0A1W1UKU4_9PAST|nr:PHB depolymerase family esterase [Pasteurella testudinis]SMB81697.1 Predicted peptidase [Pasteurella testudinis DSM 23072]SUB50335.1 Predicted esterase [Pasteurella testudinis]